MAKVQLNIRVDEEILAARAKLATDPARSLASLVEWVLSGYVAGTPVPAPARGTGHLVPRIDAMESAVDELRARLEKLEHLADQS